MIEDSTKLKQAARECAKLNKSTSFTIQYVQDVTKMDRSAIVNYLQKEEHSVKRNSNRN